MKYEFIASFSYAMGTVQGECEPFEASSIDELIQKVNELVDGDWEVQEAERFCIETPWDEDNPDAGIDYVYEVKLRKNTLGGEKDEMLDDLRKCAEEQNLFDDND